MTGPLDSEFAVRERVDSLIERAPQLHGEAFAMQALGLLFDVSQALARIEEHTHNTEEALRDQAEPIMDERFRDRLLRHVLSNEEVGQLVSAVYEKQTRALAALAALSAGEGTPA